MINLKQFILILVCCASVTTHAQSSKTILITYFSKTAHTRIMAEAVANGIGKRDGVQYVLKRIEETTRQDLEKADAIILGSPVHNANAAPEVLAFISKWPFEGNVLKDKLGAVFVTAGGISAGEELVQVNLLHAMMMFGMVVMGGNEWTSAFGASAITDEPPFKIEDNKIDPLFLKKGRALGQRVAEWVMRLK